MLKRKTGNEEWTGNVKKIKRGKKNKGYTQKTLQFGTCDKNRREIFSLHNQVYGILVSYLKDYKSRSKSYSHISGKQEKLIIIQGQPGSGKTFLIRQIAADLNLELLEINYSMNKSKSNILKILEECTNTFTIERNNKSGTLIFIDDIDIISEYDTSLYSGIQTLLKNSKAPIILTCCTIPKDLNTVDSIKLYKLGGYTENSVLIIQNYCEINKFSIPEYQIRNVLLGSCMNLNRVFSFLMLKNFDSFYGPEFRILNENLLRVEKASEDFEGIVKEQAEIEFSGGVYCEFLQNLVEVDLMMKFKDQAEGEYRVASYFEGLEKVYKKGFEEKEVIVGEKLRKDYKKIVKDNFMHVSNIEDYLSFVQILDALPGTLHPLCMSWQVRMRLSYLDVFLE